MLEDSRAVHCLDISGTLQENAEKRRNTLEGAPIIIDFRGRNLGLNNQGGLKTKKPKMNPGTKSHEDK